MEKRRAIKTWPWISLAVLFLFSGPLSAQKSGNWRIYRSVDGLRDSFTTAISASPQGNILAKHGEADAISILNGYEVTHLPSPGGGNYRVYQNRTGQFWLIHSEGLQEFREGGWMLHPIQEIRTEYQSNLLRKVRQIPLVPLQRDRVLVLLSDRLVEFNATINKVSLLRLASETKLEKFLDMTAAHDGGLWVTGAKGLAKVAGPPNRLDATSAWQDFPFEARLGILNLQRPFEDADRELTGVAEATLTNKKVLVHFDGRQWQVHQVNGENIRQAWRTLDSGYWVLTMNSMWRFEEGHKQALENEGISAGQFFDVLSEPKGVFWLATSEGLVRFAPLAWRSPPLLERGSPDPQRDSSAEGVVGRETRAPTSGADLHALVYSIQEDARHRLWLATPNSLNLVENGRIQSFPLSGELDAFFQPTGKLLVLTNGLMAFNANDRFLLFDPKKESFRTVNPPAGKSVKLLGVLNDGRLCVQTFQPDVAAHPLLLETYDGEEFQPYREIPTEVISTHDLGFVHEAQNGDLWVGGPSSLSVYQNQKWQSFGRNDNYPSKGAFCILEVGYGKVWVGSEDKISAFDGKSWSVLGSGFDRVNALIKTREDHIWCASGSGVYRYFDGAWIANGPEEGLPSSAVYDLHEDHQGRFWAGTARGVSLYHPDADTDPPKTFIRQPEEAIKTRTDDVTMMSFYGRDKWKYTSADRLLYSYHLDNGPWSPYSPEMYASFRRLAAGTHRFEVHAMDRNWKVDPQPAFLDFVVIVPWHREPRLLASIIFGLVVAIFFAALAFNRHRRLLRSYAEVGKIVELRTRELEVAHQELLHSQKMRALGTLAAGIAHDFNNILSIIKGSAQIIENSLENREKIRTRLERIKTVVEQGSGIVKAMLGYSRLRNDPSEEFVVAETVEQTIKLLGDHFVQRVRVYFETPPQLPKGKGSADLIKQMLVNLIFNAADSLEGEGTVLLRAGLLDHLPEKLVLTPPHCARYVFITVQDEGYGIPPEILPRIFEPFFTTKSLSTQRGTGLGLSMVYEFAKEMGYGIIVESALGKGSTFMIIIPAATPTVNQAEAEKDLARQSK
jgi:signal transduction histidine kinase